MLLLYWRIEDEFGPREVEQLTALDEGQRSNLIINVDIWQQLNSELKTDQDCSFKTISAHEFT